MTPLQKRLFLVLALAVGLTRLLAISRGPFDWDEALFSVGVRDYDVAQHHPHPPGYPLFVAAAKVVHLFGLEEFRALQVVVVFGAVFLFPALVFLAREIGFDFTTSIIGAAIFAFLPNVWVYGGTAFSDVPATAIGFGACALLLRGRRDSRAYIAGAILLGIAAGIRPPYLLIGAAPALLATWHRIRARAWVAIAVAMIAGAAIVAASYYGAALASSSVDGYVDAVRAQSKYVRDIDSFRNPHRPPLSEVAKIFFLWPVQQQQQAVGLALLSIMSLVAAIITSRAAPWLTLAIFGPFAILAWLNLDVATAARYAISYMAVHALLAADGLRIVGLAAGQPSRGPLARRRAGGATAGESPAPQVVQSVLGVLAISVFVVWTWPAVGLQRRSDPPHVSAMRWILRNVPPSSPVYVQGAYGPHIAYYFPGREVRVFEETGDISLMSGDSWILDRRLSREGMNFAWPHQKLWRIIRRRNFECSLSRVSSIIHFGEGWYGLEGSDADTFRWTSKDARATLSALRGNGRLAMRIRVPLDALSSPPVIEVRMNGVLVGSVRSDEPVIERSWIVPSRRDAPNELQITTSATINPSHAGDSADTRELGLRIESLSWMPAR